MSKTINLVKRLQNWMDSVPGQTFLNYTYSWGAALVILGALFKLTHIPGANLMLFISMGTEAFVFFLSAFDRPFDRTSIGKELPTELPTDEEIIRAEESAARMAVKAVATTDEAEGTPQVVSGGGSVVIGGEMPAGGSYGGGVVVQGEGGVAAGTVAGGAVGGGTIVIGGGGGSVPASEGGAVQTVAVGGDTPADGSELLPEAAAAGISIPRDADTEQLTAIIRDANNELLHRAQAVLSPEMEAVTKTYIERLRTLTDTLSKVDEQGARLARDNEEMERLSRTLTSINSIYELQLKGASSQVVTIDQINEQTHQLVSQIEELNAVYARMIKALTINAKAAGANE